MSVAAIGSSSGATTEPRDEHAGGDGVELATTIRVSVAAIGSSSGATMEPRDEHAGDDGVELAVTPRRPPRTDAVAGRLDSGPVVAGLDAIAVSRITGVVVVALAAVCAGRVLAITDSSMLGHESGANDNSCFVENFALH